MMEDIQNRVLELIGTRGSLLEVNLIKYEIKLKEQIQFEGGKSVIKEVSYPLCQQLSITKQCIAQTCREFGVDNMHWRVEGHTAKSKKSKDGGIGTSNGRAKAVCDYLGRNGVEVSTLHPEGCGCFHPPEDPKADPRRVEIHVMKQSEVRRLNDTAKAFRSEEQEAGNGGMIGYSAKEIIKTQGK